MEKHPGLGDEESRVGELVIDQKGTGARQFALKDADKYQKLLLVLVCDQEAAYSVMAGNASNTKLSGTWGDSCGGPTINTFLTPAYDLQHAAQIPTFIQVKTPVNTNYYLSVYGIPAQLAAPSR